MNTSDNIDHIGPAWVAALNAVGNVTEDASGHHGKYATLGACLGVVKPVLAEHDLAVQQYNRPGADGKVVVVTRIWHTSGEWLEDEGLAMAAPSDPQKVGGAVTYARRYSLTTFFAISTTDDDGQAATDHMRASTTTTRQQAPQAAQAPPDDDGYCEAATRVYNSLRSNASTVGEHMKAWRAEQGDNVPGFSLADLDGDHTWLDLVANELADTLERTQA